MSASATPLHAIDPSLTYPLPLAKKFFGGKSAWLSARRKGLKDRIRTVGRRGFISGADLIEFIEQEGEVREYHPEA